MVQPSLPFKPISTFLLSLSYPSNRSLDPALAHSQSLMSFLSKLQQGAASSISCHNLPALPTPPRLTIHRSCSLVQEQRRLPAKPRPSFPSVLFV